MQNSNEQTLTKLKGGGLLLRLVDGNVWIESSPQAQAEIWRQAVENPDGFSATTFCLTLGAIIKLLGLQAKKEDTNDR